MGNWVRNNFRKIMESVEYRGIVGTGMAGIRGIFSPLLTHQRVIQYLEDRFDRKFGVNTAGVIRHENLHIESPSAIHATDYEAAPSMVFKEVIAGLRIDYREFTFVDFGCGKGKALLLASSFPFKKIIGIELSPELKDIAMENVKTYKRKSQQCRALEIIWMDAAEFPIPTGPVICYFYNPFREAIMARVLKNIEDSWNENPRNVIIIYFNPQLDYLFQGKPFLTNVRRKAWYAIYRSTGGTALIAQ